MTDRDCNVLELCRTKLRSCWATSRVGIIIDNLLRPVNLVKSSGS